MAIVVADEELLRRIVQEEMQAALTQLPRVSADSEWPLQLTVQEAAKMLRLGKNKVYDLTRRKGFPALRDGWKILIPRDALLRWMETEAQRNAGGPCEAAHES